MIDITLILIAISLAIDCFVVSVCISLSKKIRKIDYFNIPIHFGIFQGVMTLIGFYLGASFLGLIENFDHWIIFTLLLIIGGNMIYNSTKDKPKFSKKISYIAVIILAIATSIDALSVGITFGLGNGSILIKALVIGIFSLALSVIGMTFGKKIRSFKFSYLEALGGLILIGIGTKVLIEHLF